MKKFYVVLVILILIVSIFISGCSNTKEEEKKGNSKVVTISVLEHDYYKGLTLEEISSVTIIKETEDGVDEQTYEEKTNIEKNYNYWKNKKLGKKTTKSCDDNTTTYVFNLKDNATISVVKECDLVVINNERYLIK